MLKIIVALVSGLVLVSCKVSDTSTDADVATVGKTNVSVECVKTGELGRRVTYRDHVVLTVVGKEVFLDRRLLQTSVGKSDFTRQRVYGTINTVFDFNSVSHASVRVLLNPTVLKTIQDGKESERSLRSIFIEYTQGQLKVNDPDAKTIFANSNCRTKSAH